MKLAVISDVHGMVPALEAVLADVDRWKPDRLIVNGDLVNRGPYSRECLSLLRKTRPDVEFLKGNHENFVLRSAAQPSDPNAWDHDICRFAEWTAQKLGEDELSEIDGWGDAVEFSIEPGLRVHITHASKVGDRAGIYRNTPDDDLAEKVGSNCDLFICSHTHRPMRRQFNGTHIINIGSVGQPIDDDPRAAYGQFEFHAGQWRAKIRRVEFDRERAMRDFAESGFLDEAGPVARLIAREFEAVRSHVGPWRSRYMEALKAGECSVSDSIQCYLDSL